MKKISIIGAGVWGSAIAKLLSNHKVLIYSRNIETVKSINSHKINPKLKYVIFNDNVKSTSNILDLADSDYIFIALPTQQIREALNDFKKFVSNQTIIIGSKGIEINTHLLPSEIVESVLENLNICILSGPCFSHEVAQNLPTAVTLATKNEKCFNFINELFINKNFRIYHSNDLVGCQIGGAIKNIYAIASGITLGLNLGENAKSALISRSFSEIINFGKIIGANSNTLFGLSGLGDLILTCNSLKSRNTNFGYLISSQQKISIEDHLKSQDTTEGYFTVQAVYNIAKEKNIEMPIANAIYKILFEKALINDEIKKLLNRPTKKDFH
tara:strand:- start:558 stop:1541 length:984 start_codon:yes stop_codon:yes gene_type:complete